MLKCQKSESFYFLVYKWEKESIDLHENPTAVT